MWVSPPQLSELLGLLVTGMQVWSSIRIPVRLYQMDLDEIQGEHVYG